MAISKTKAIEAAQKLVSQNKLKEAIAEYQKIHREDPKDVNVLNTLGDLCTRLNNTAGALDYYNKLADLYVSDGFLVRGIAMCKKISKLDPANTAALERLADLYTMQGLMSEARAQYLQLAEVLLKANQGAKAMATLEKVLDLDPTNVKIQQRLADLYERHGQGKEAANIYRRLADHLLQDNKAAESLKWLEKAAHLAPDDAEVLLATARAQQRSGHAQQSLRTLEKIPNLEQNPEALELLLSARLGTGDTRGADQLAEKLFAADPTKYSGLLQLARHAAKEQDGARALTLLERIAEPALAHEPVHLLEAIREVVAVLPDSAEALELLVRAARKAGSQSTLLEALNRQAQAAAAAEDYTRAKHLYDELVSLEPENPGFTQQLNRMREKLGEPAVATEAAQAEAAPVEAAAVAEVVLDEETQAYVNSTLTDIDLFSSYGMADKAIELARQLISRVPGHLVAHERLLDFYVGSGNDQGVVDIAARLKAFYRQAGNEARAEEVAKLAHGYAEKLGKAVPAEAPAEVAAATPAAAAAPAETGLHEVDLSAEWAAATAAEETAAAPAEVLEAPAAAFNAAEAGEEINFYLAQGLHDQAREAVARYEQSFPGEPAVAELRARVEAAMAPAEAAPVEPIPVLPIPAEPVPAAAAAGEGETFEVTLEAQPKEAAAAGAPMGATDFFADLAGELDAALAPVAPPAAGKKAGAPPPAPKVPAAPAAGGEPSVGVLAEVFEEFKGEMGEVEEVEDVETHYNLGIAYKEMGLLDEAISEFQKVTKTAEKTKSYSHLFQCCTLLGLCFMDKGLPLIAVRWYERALKAPGLDEEGALALRYDMGVAHEQAGNRKAALDCFMEVYGANVDYRNVGERIRELQGA